MFNEMGGNYKVNNHQVKIIKTVELEKDQLKIRNPRCLQWYGNNKYPLWKKTDRRTHKRYRNVVSANRPVCYKTGVTEVL